MMSEKTKQATQLLQEKNLSLTLPRKLILTLLMKDHGPYSAEEIYKKLPKNSCDLATVYRALKQFVEVGLVNTSYLENFTMHYEFNDPRHHHHHIVCKICRKIESLHDCLMEKIHTNLEKKGYKDIQHRLEFFGICEDCQNT